MNIKTSGKTKPTEPAAQSAAPAVGTTPPPQLRRRPLVIVAAVAAICLGALLSVWLWTSSSTAVEVLAVRDTVYRGEVLQADDLVTVRVNLDPAIRAVPASSLAEVAGKVAGLDVAAGSLLTEEAVQPAVVPGAGFSVVGVSLAPGLLPAIPLQVGDQVRVVQTPGVQGEPSKKAPLTITASVTAVTPSPDGQVTVVDLLLPSGRAADLAALAATGKVALVLDSRQR